MPPTPQLNYRHVAVLRFIRQHQAEKGYPPTLREIGKAIGVGSTSLVDYYVNGLEKRGLIHREPALARSITVTAAGRAAAQTP